MIPFHFALQLSSKHFLIQFAFRLSACSDGSGTSSPPMDLHDFKMVRFILSRFLFQINVNIIVSICLSCCRVGFSITVIM